MRRTILTLVAAATLLGAPATFAAPSCVDRNGDMIRCATPGAMPVGWSPPAEKLAQRRAALSPGPSPRAVFAGLSLLVALLGLIALMPDFDGWGDERDGQACGAGGQGKRRSEP